MRSRYDWKDIDEFLIENYETLGAQKCSEILNIPYNTLRSRAYKKLKLGFYKSVEWSDELIEFIKLNYEQQGCVFIAKKFDVPESAVYKKAQQLGLKYVPKYDYISTQGYRVCGSSTKPKAEHRTVMENHLKRKLLPSELVHHKDENKLNNEISNLELTSRREHMNHHRKSLKRVKV